MKQMLSRIGQRKMPLRDRSNYYYLLGTITLVVLCGYGVLASASTYVGANANGQAGDAFYYLKRQTVAIVIGAVLLTFLSHFNYRRLREYAPHALVLSIGLLAFLYVSPHALTAMGATRGFQFGFFSFQPSELAKAVIAVWIVGATLSIKDHLEDIQTIIVRICVPAGAVAALIVFQPDLGSASIVCAITLLGLYFGGIGMRQLQMLFAALFTMGVVFIALEPYRLDRLLGVLHPSETADDQGFQLMQSLYALGSGNIAGVGYFDSHQKYGFIPAVHTDFIFAVLGEEWGLIGSAFMILCFAALIVIGMRISSKSGDTYGRNLAMVITSYIGLQVLINMLSVVGFMPITGVPLPFISYGGSSMIFSLALIGILLNIAATSNVVSGVRREKDRDHGRWDRGTSKPGTGRSRIDRKIG